MGIFRIESDRDNEDTILDKIKYKYWKIIPYNWRPGQICYRLNCYFFKKYTTIKPRTIKYHTWCDKTELIPHVMFECLTQFIENECSPGHVDWYHKYEHEGVERIHCSIIVDGEERFVRDVMQELYDWWHNEYLPWFRGEVTDKLYDSLPDTVMKFTKCEDNEHLSTMDFEYPNDENGADKTREIYDQINKIEAEMKNKLNKNLHILVDCIGWMWT